MKLHICFILLLLSLCPFLSIGSPGKSRRTHHKIFIPTRVKYIHHTKYIKIPEYHHYFHDKETVHHNHNVNLNPVDSYNYPPLQQNSQHQQHQQQPQQTYNERNFAYNHNNNHHYNDHQYNDHHYNDHHYYNTIN